MFKGISNVYKNMINVYVYINITRLFIVLFTNFSNCYDELCMINVIT